MIRAILGDSSLTGYALVGLVIFVAVFIAVCAWALTRRRSQVETWSRLPLANDPLDSHIPAPAEARRSRHHE
jgi:cbb3-type cytochrome oxidase subunit 3